jgi:hypothetical protein
MALIAEDDPTPRGLLREAPTGATPDERCAWCWPLLYPGQAYPNEWSSTICEAHSASIQAQHVRLRIQRIAAKEMRTS